MAANKKHWPLHGKQRSTDQMWSQKGNAAVVDGEIGCAGTGADVSSGSSRLTQKLRMQGAVDFGAKSDVAPAILAPLATEERRSSRLKARRSGDGKGRGSADDEKLGSPEDPKRGGAAPKRRRSNVSTPPLQSPPTGGAGNGGAGDAMTAGDDDHHDMGGAADMRGKRSDHPNSRSMIQGGGSAAMGAQKSPTAAAELVTAPIHAAAYPPAAHAGRSQKRAPAPIGEVGGEIVMKGGCRYLVCAGKAISLARQQKASACTVPTPPPFTPNA